MMSDHALRNVHLDHHSDRFIKHVTACPRFRKGLGLVVLANSRSKIRYVFFVDMGVEL